MERGARRIAFILLQRSRTKPGDENVETIADLLATDWHIDTLRLALTSIWCSEGRQIILPRAQKEKTSFFPDCDSCPRVLIYVLVHLSLLSRPCLHSTSHAEPVLLLSVFSSERMLGNALRISFSGERSYRNCRRIDDVLHLFSLGEAFGFFAFCHIQPAIPREPIMTVPATRILATDCAARAARTSSSAILLCRLLLRRFRSITRASMDGVWSRLGGFPMGACALFC